MANIALWQIGVFNQLVRQQSDFNALYLPEIGDSETSAEWRAALAKAAGSISYMLHRNGIGEGEWYAILLGAIEENREVLVEHRGRRWKRRTSPWAPQSP
jgi:hypothetical protein